MAHFAVTTILACIIIMITSFTQLAITGNLLRMHYNCYETPNVVKGSGYFMKVLYKQYIEDIFCPGAQRPYKLAASPTVELWIIISIMPTALSLASSFVLACITIVDSWQAHLQVVLCFTYAIYIANLALDIIIATEFARDYIKLTEDLDTRIAGQDSNYTLDLARIGAFIIVFVILKGIVIHVINVVLVITSTISLPGHMRRQQARKNGPIPFGKLSSTMARRANALAAVHRMAHAVVLRNELPRALGTQSAEDSLRQINSFDDLPRFRRLQSTRARRARAAARLENQIRQLRFEEPPSPPTLPPPPPPPPPRKSCHQQRCTCSRRRRARAPSLRPLPTPTSPPSPKIHATTVTTDADVEAMDMAVAGPSGLARATGSQESSEYITVEL